MADQPLVKIAVDGDASERVRTLSVNMSSWLRSAVGDVAKAGIEFIKRNYLSGHPFRKETGELYESVKLFYVKAEKAWYIRPGVGVKGSLNYLAKWNKTNKEFMKPGFKRFIQGPYAEEYIARKLEERPW